jgi:hypothetical protein
LDSPVLYLFKSCSGGLRRKKETHWTRRKGLKPVPSIERNRVIVLCVDDNRENGDRATGPETPANGIGEEKLADAPTGENVARL